MADTADDGSMEVLHGEACPVCHEKTLTLMQAERDIPFFGKVLLFSMHCTGCNYHKADVEAGEQHEPVRYAIDIEGEEDLSIRVIKSSEATVRIPRVGDITPGPASNGYVTNVEGIIGRIKKQIESVRDNDEETPEARKKAKSLIKKLQKVLWGREPLKIILEDPSGNSAIVSEKAVKQRLK